MEVVSGACGQQQASIGLLRGLQASTCEFFERASTVRAWLSVCNTSVELGNGQVAKWTELNEETTTEMVASFQLIFFERCSKLQLKAI